MNFTISQTTLEANSVQVALPSYFFVLFFNCTFLSETVIRKIAPLRRTKENNMTFNNEGSTLKTSLPLIRVVLFEYSSMS